MSWRLSAGGSRIDRSRPVEISFDGRALAAFAGDTLASALLANGIDIVGRSIHDERPRGVVSAGPEEPSALVQVRWPDGASEPMVRATTLLVEDGLTASSLAGKGRLETTEDGARFDAVHKHVEVLIVGAGASGLAAAAAARAARPDDRILVVDADPRASGPDVLADTTVLGLYDHGFAIAVQRRPTATTEGRTWRIRAGRTVLATGATERPIAFANDDRPGIMLAGAAAAYVERYGVAPGRHAVIFTTNDTTTAVAATLVEAGIEVVGMVDARRGEVVVDTLADAAGRLAGVLVARLGDDGGVDPATVRTLAADLLAVSGGWNPNVALWSQARGTLRFDPGIAAFVPDAPGPQGGIEAVGSAAGDIDDLGTVAPLWVVPPLRPVGAATTDATIDPWATHYVDLGRDATVATLRRALGAGLESIEHVKRYTTIGTGADQGKTSGVLTSAIAAAILGQEVGAIGVPTYRPPTSPVTFAQLAGRDRGWLADPVRVTSLHPWHVAHGAVFEDVGQWKRPRFFPQPGESMDDAVLRESSAARTTVAAMDATTLGKIDLQGPDAATFLDRIYTNTFSTLKVGSCRYGLMCRADGMVFDDGVTARLAEDRFLMTTTTGNAAAVLDHLEEWLQTEWPDLRVAATSVTEQWATVAVVGPRSREVVAALVPSLDVSNGAFPFMTWREAVIVGTPGRVFRISFSGELAFELNVPTWHGQALWEAVLAGGEDVGSPVTPYGTETLHVLRAEKGYPIIGQETDGTTTPQDLGLGALVSTKKDFIGRRSLRRPDAIRPDRKQLVGLLPVDPEVRLPEGAQLVARDVDLGQSPVPMLGHVTSSYRSAALGRTFALALIRGGRDRVGERVVAPLLDGTVVEADIGPSVLFDPDNTRRDGEPAA
ncbi:MAG TPA: 2Fe-2S iron-sulfur cluster-binding protein [Candidatus Saccharimonadales bacterium]|nr:2Fe-2S iron-sulfur cluster-binding protein [Candidatus Saccharimonadales bacterium]